MDPKYDQPVMKLFDAVASEVSQDALGQILRGCVIYLRKWNIDCFYRQKTEVMMRDKL